MLRTTEWEYYTRGAEMILENDRAIQCGCNGKKGYKHFSIGIYSVQNQLQRIIRKIIYYNVAKDIKKIQYFIGQNF